MLRINVKKCKVAQRALKSIKYNIDTIGKFLKSIENDYHRLLREKLGGIEGKCRMSNYMLARILSHRFSLPINTDKGNRLELRWGGYKEFPGHYWIKLVLNDEEFFICATMGQFISKYKEKIWKLSD